MFLFLVKQSMCVSSLCSPTGHTGPVCVRVRPLGGRWREAQERWAVLLRPVQAFTPGDKHVLRCEERTGSRLGVSPVVFKGKHPLRS